MNKSLRSAIISALALSAMLTTSCSDDDTTTSVNLMTAYVTVSQAQDGTTLLIADNDALLKPSNAYLLSSWLPKVRRAVISFTVEGAPDMTAQDLKAGVTYPIKIDNTTGQNGAIPSFTECVDVTSNEYLSDGNDTINSDGRRLINLTEVMPPYIANGYVNIAPAFAYSSQVPVNFMLYYEGEQSIDAQNGEVKLGLYFNNHTEYAEFSSANLISLAIPEEIGDKLLEAGLDESSKVTVSLSAKVATGVATAKIETTVGDFFPY